MSISHGDQTKRMYRFSWPLSYQTYDIYGMEKLILQQRFGYEKGDTSDPALHVIYLLSVTRSHNSEVVQHHVPKL